jgi:hypothetical protein|tara:strand:+ start:118 stop:1209 length:1092 start_codon:yes stop_codon:yes gene_type:complete
MDAMNIPHWVVGGKHIYNQLDAWEEIVRSKREFRWYFYDHTYDRHDWSAEPKQTWNELLHHRCLQLRQKYRKLCLWYSGGSDSHHVLRSFAKHNIPIDELLLLHWKMNPYRNAEYHDWLLPLANEYKRLKNPNVKIRTVEVTSKMYGKYYGEQTAESKHFTGTNGFFTPCDFDWQTIHTCNITDSSTGVIVALEKPHLYLSAGKIYHRFHDKTFELYRGTISEFEFFYYAPEMPELYIKQCHMLANHIKQHYPGKDQDFFDQFIENPHGPYYTEFCEASGRDPAIHKDARTQNGKNKLAGTHHTFLDIADMAKKDGFKSVQIWENTMAHWKASMPEAFPGKQDFRQGGTVGIHSNKKYIMDYV